MPNHDPSAEHRLTDLALGLLAFLEEVSEYRAICIRAAPFTEISRGPGNALILATRYRCSKRDERLLARRVRAAEEWPSDLTIEDSSVVLLQTLSPPPAVRDLPSFPLRRVAQTVLFQESLVRGLAVTPLRGERDPESGLWPLQAYLQWAMSGMSDELRSLLVNWPTD